MKQAGATTLTGDGVLGGVGGARGPVDAVFAQMMVGFGGGRGRGVFAPLVVMPGAEEAVLAAGEGVRGAEGPVSAAEVLTGSLATAAGGVERAGELGPGELVSVFDPGVIDGLEVVGEVRAKLDGVGVALAAEASTRGLHLAVGLSLVDWLRVRCPGMSVSEAGQVRDVVRAGEKHWGKSLLAAVAAGVIAVHRGAKIARTMTRLAGSLDAGQREVYADIATASAADPQISDRDLEVVCKKLLLDLLDAKPKEERERAAQQLRCVSRRPLREGLTRYTVDAPDSEAALLEGVFNGPLAAPEPIEAGAEEGAEVDVRSPGQRSLMRC